MNLGNVFGRIQKNDHKDVQVKAELQRVTFEFQPNVAIRQNLRKNLPFLLNLPFEDMIEPVNF